MANETAKPNFFQKVGRFFKNLGLKIANSFKMMYHELKKVTWPSRKELVNYTLVVIAFMVATGIIMGLIDAGASALSQLITH